MSCKSCKNLNFLSAEWIAHQHSTHGMPIEAIEAFFAERLKEAKTIIERHKKTGGKEGFKK